jgi:iron-sulfur cluster repair protein YtfE (RIC family)
MTSPSTLLDQLLWQHDQIRDLIGRCDALLDATERDSAQVAELVVAVARLRWAVESHNRVEEQLLSPVLRETDAFGDQRAEYMVEAHRKEHSQIGQRLDKPVVDSLRQTLSDLREHLDTEERYFLTSRVLRDDVVTVEPGG